MGLGRSARSSGRGRVSVGGNSFRIIPVSIVAIRQSGYNIGRHKRTHRGPHWVAADTEHLPQCIVGIDSRARDATGACSEASLFLWEARESWQPTLHMMGLDVGKELTEDALLGESSDIPGLVPTGEHLLTSSRKRCIQN